VARIASKWRIWLQPLRHTILHPQWFVFREQRDTQQWVCKNARGLLLDIGCADGWVREVASADCEYVGLDYPATARDIYGTRPNVYADGTRLPFFDDSFDTVVLLEVLEHVLEPQSVLAEISRVLRPHGTLLLSMPFLYPLHDAPHDYQRYTAPGLAHRLRAAGLECEEPVARVVGIRSAALLAAVACAAGVLDACNRRRWRLIFAPLFVAAIPLINVAGWVLGGIGCSSLLAAGHRVIGRKP
jgi:SAM-dependent methyltransferase